MKESISREEFLHRTGLKIPQISEEITDIVPMKDIVFIEHLIVMPEEYLWGLLRNVTLEGDSSIQPYKDATFERARIDPYTLAVGQTFVERKKYQRLIESLSSMFGSFATTRGFAKCTAFIVIGKTKEGKRGIAHYLPPINEYHGSKLCLIDGTHRDYITLSIGTTIESIIIRNAYEPPCDFSSWKDVQVVEEKPPREERFINLRRELFRNLGWCGIDG